CGGCLPRRPICTGRLCQHDGRDQESQNCDERSNNTGRIIASGFAGHTKPPSGAKAGAVAEVDHATSITRGRSFSYERSDLELPGPKYGSPSRSKLLARGSQRSKSPPQGCACRGRPASRRDDANQCNTNLCEMSVIDVTYRRAVIA